MRSTRSCPCHTGQKGGVEGEKRGGFKFLGATTLNILNWHSRSEVASRGLEEYLFTDYCPYWWRLVRIKKKAENIYLERAIFI